MRVSWSNKNKIENMNATQTNLQQHVQYIRNAFKCYTRNKKKKKK